MRLITTNLVMSSTVTVSSQDIYFPITNLKNQLRSKRFRTTSKTDQWIVNDLGSAKPVDSVIVLLPKEGTISSTQVIKIQANATNVWTTPSLDITMTVSEYRQASHYFASDETYRYWRLSITDPSATTNYVEISKLVIGKAEVIQCAQNGFKINYDDYTKNQSNEFGTVYSDIFPTIKTFSLNYNVLTYEEIVQLEDIFIRLGSHNPIFVVLDETDVTFDKDRYSIYGLLSDSFDITHVNYKLFNSSGYKIVELN